MKNKGTFTLGLLGIFLIVYILVIWKALIIPFVLACVIFYLILLWAQLIEKITLLERKIPRGISMFLSFVGIIGILFYFVGFVSDGVSDFVEIYPEKYKPKVETWVTRVIEFLWVPQQDVAVSVTEDNASQVSIFTSIDFDAVLGQIENPERIVTAVGSEVASITGNIGLILFYMLFLFIEYRVIGTKFRNIFPRQSSYKEAKQLVNKILQDTNTYISIKAGVSFFVWLLSYIVLKILWVDLAEFWALLLFALNFIPYIGSIIAVIFPSAIALIQFSWPEAVGGIISLQFILTVSLLLGIQVLMWNIVEPRWMGSSLNLSPLVILISLTVWGTIWWVVGMLLCIPITVAMNIILSNFEKTKKIAILLSQSGEVG